jgi:hypothetical protein
LLIRHSLARGTVPQLSSYRKPKEEPKKGHNHPMKEKCGEHCPRNEHYKGPVKKFDFFRKRK